MDENEIDKLVCEKFNLTYSDKDYGHFFFTESEAEDFHHQESISWVGLLDCIIFYSFIESGKRSNYEIEAALAWIRHYAVEMPFSTVHFLSDLLHFLKEKGYYVYVYGHSVGKEDDYFLNKYQGESIFENESGLFLYNNNGSLRRFFPAIENLLDKSLIRERYSFHEAYYKPCVHILIIPEGVRSIENHFFERGLVKERVSLPSTLEDIGSCAFSSACLPEIVFPINVHKIDSYAFENSIIKSVKFSQIVECENLCQFKDARIETLYLPIVCKQEWLQGSDNYAYLHNIKEVEFY